MRKLLVCQHVAHEILGTLNPLLKGAGFRIHYVNFGRHPDAQPRLEGYHGLIVLGGPMSVNHADRYPHLTTEMKLIEQAMRNDLPVLGICLGAQLIARTLGAGVYRNPETEIGWYDVSPTERSCGDRLLAPFGEKEKIFQWHGDTFEIPPGAVHLASSARCANQAFRYEAKVYALQFHLEVDEPMIERWLRVPGNIAEIESLTDGIDVDAIRRETRAHIGRLKQLSRHTFNAFIALFGAEKKRRRFPSR